MNFRSNSSQETIALGARFAKCLRPEDVVIFSGQLGAGKTTFVQGILNGLSIRKRALSPTFTLMRQYRTRNITLYHVDLYRVAAGDIAGIGLDDYIYAPKSVVLIEWGDKIERILPRYIVIKLMFRDESGRTIAISGKGLGKRDFSA